jgi:uncharacterized protein YndB with AHSA1/START domain
MAPSLVDASVLVRAPIALVFERITDHEAMVSWPGIQACRLIVEGTPRNGLGAVRRIKANGVTLDERVVNYEPPVRYDYQIIRGLPVKHLGTVRLNETPEGVRVTWHIELSSWVPGIAPVVAFLLQRGLPGALNFFAASVMQAQPSAQG